MRGKAALRTYWAEGLYMVPDLHFEVVGVYAGVDAIAMYYRNQKRLTEATSALRAAG